MNYTIDTKTNAVIYKGSKFGKNVVIWHNAIVREKNKIGNDVVIGANTYIGPGNKIGNNVKIHTSCFLESVTIFDNVIVSPHVVFTNDPYPPCKVCMKEIGGATVGKNTVIGAHVTILPGITIGENVLIGAGSVVTKDIPDNVVVVGNPAKILRKNTKHIHR